MDLSVFCNPTGSRVFTRQPWSCGAFTYAVDGHIAVRVGRNEDVALLDAAECPAGAIDRWLVDAEQDQRQAVPALQLPKPGQTECKECEGSGSEHDCPHCSCACEECHGVGYFEAPVVVRYGIVMIDGKHWRRIAPLPGAKLSKLANKNGHLSFEFEGGLGIVMPMRWPPSNAAIVDAAGETIAA
jgi:hypothetical protein